MNLDFIVSDEIQQIQKAFSDFKKQKGRVGEITDVLDFVKLLYQDDNYGSFSIVIKLENGARYAFVDPLNEIQLYLDLECQRYLTDFSTVEISRFNKSYKPASSYLRPEPAYNDIAIIEPFKLYELAEDLSIKKVLDFSDMKIPAFDPEDTLKSVLIERAFRANLDQYDQNEIGLFYSGGFDSSCVKSALDLHDINPVEITLDRIAGDYKPTKPLSYYMSIVQEPFDLGGVIPEIKLFEKAKELGIKIVFNGDGADELFGGYRKSRSLEDNLAEDMRVFWYYSSVKIKRVAEHFGIKVVSPFHHRKFLGLSRQLDWPDRKNKSILRAMATFLPDEIRLKEKEPMKDLDFDFKSQEYQEAQIKALLEGATKETRK